MYGKNIIKIFIDTVLLGTTLLVDAPGFSTATLSVNQVLAACSALNCTDIPLKDKLQQLSQSKPAAPNLA